MRLTDDTMISIGDAMGIGNGQIIGWPRDSDQLPGPVITLYDPAVMTRHPHPAAIDRFCRPALALAFLLIAWQVIGTSLHASTPHDTGEKCQICVVLDRLDAAETPAEIPDLAVRPDAQPIAGSQPAPSFRTDPGVRIRAPPLARHD